MCSRDRTDVRLASTASALSTVSPELKHTPSPDCNFHCTLFVCSPNIPLLTDSTHWLWLVRMQPQLELLHTRSIYTCETLHAETYETVCYQYYQYHYYCYHHHYYHYLMCQSVSQCGHRVATWTHLFICMQWIGIVIMAAGSLFTHHVVCLTVRLFQLALFNQLLIFDACIWPYQKASKSNARQACLLKTKWSNRIEQNWTVCQC